MSLFLCLGWYLCVLENHSSAVYYSGQSLINKKITCKLSYMYILGEMYENN
jgi:hypothetical protein